jgi:proline racemase
MATFSRCINVIDSHTAGEPTRIVTAGLPALRGATIAEKWQYARQNLNSWRKLLMLEPRGHADMFGAILTAPCDPRADYGLLFCDTGGWLTMCGHGTIGAAVSLVQLGWVPATPPETIVRFDTPAGLVEAHVLTDGRSAQTAWVENVPSFMYAHDLRLSVPGVGDLTCDISFGGNFFLIVPAEQVGLNIEPKNGRRLVELGLTILRAANAAFPVRHPTETHIQSIELVEFTQPGANGADYRNVVVFGDGNFDRSPCGTGTCARMAELYALGRLKLGQTFVHESIIGTRFEGHLASEATVGPYKAVVPRFKGSAYITGLNTLVLDPADPLQEGFNALGLG